LSLKKWPLHSKPHFNQLLYRWVEQLAEAYGVSYTCFCKNVLELTSEEISNFRSVFPEKALLILSNGTGIPTDDLRTRDAYTMYKISLEELSQWIETHPEEHANFLSKSIYTPLT
jgi:hypothetical protein